MSCHLLIRNKETGEAVGLALCNFEETKKKCIEEALEDKFGLYLETEEISQTEFETYQTLKLFKEYTWADVE